MEFYQIVDIIPDPDEWCPVPLAQGIRGSYEDAVNFAKKSKWRSYKIEKMILVNDRYVPEQSHELPERRHEMDLAQIP